MTSRWISAAIVLLFVALVGQRIYRYATFDPATLDTVRSEPEMPRPIVDAEERELYLTAGGAYTEADIAANGPALPSQKYRSFRANHDLRPQPGDKLCPITRTKASAECTWIVAGRSYEFCCPPCIAEFVRLAKEKPERIQPPEAFVQPPQ
jgi:hypothetical protein